MLQFKYWQVHCPNKRCIVSTDTVQYVHVVLKENNCILYKVTDYKQVYSGKFKQHFNKATLSKVTEHL